MHGNMHLTAALSMSPPATPGQKPAEQGDMKGSRPRHALSETSGPQNSGFFGSDRMAEWDESQRAVVSWERGFEQRAWDRQRLQCKQFESTRDMRNAEATDRQHAGAGDTSRSNDEDHT
eukprot:CAMPEP_0195015412 /NCGR_PEP_ID=MMETSP0326_2-20130528/19610_1 /TAXON_ID=2866 ORGANISM="Crypthecodinium cohnii, Strain Seligo" /NCGR_SAMPLE_ID=MMETSP0326_2 /ASSEMBLY_ACC=CAM_ASM_000348 /LENGTH=118 /DNA_ID=CAMNT_0040029661 /DNA_START=142 /DNA_END=496 /DNA_ORIENTATION=-